MISIIQELGRGTVGKLAKVYKKNKYINKKKAIRAERLATKILSGPQK